MKKIGITVEVRKRYYEEVEISDEQYEKFVNGKIDELDIPEIDLTAILAACNKVDHYTCDYAIADDQGKTIVDWSY